MFVVMARASLRFGDVYERIENSKQEEMIKLEKQRMEFTKEVEFQRLNMFMETQLELDKMKKKKPSTTGSSPALKYPFLAKRLACMVLSRTISLNYLDILQLTLLSPEMISQMEEEFGLLIGALEASGITTKQLTFLTTEWYTGVLARIRINAVHIGLAGGTSYEDLLASAIASVKSEASVGNAVYLLPSFYKHDCGSSCRYTGEDGLKMSVPSENAVNLAKAIQEKSKGKVNCLSSVDTNHGKPHTPKVSIHVDFVVKVPRPHVLEIIQQEYKMPITIFQVSENLKEKVSAATEEILEADLQQVAMVMGVTEEIDVTDDISNADAILASSYEMKENPWIRSVAKFHQLPVFVIKSTTMAQMVKAIRMILGRDSFGAKLKQTRKSSIDIEIEDDVPRRKPSLEEIDALEEVRLAIEYIVIPSGEPVELLPRCSEIIAQQLELVKSYQLAVENSGTDLNPRIQILPHKLNKKSGKSTPTGGVAGTSVARLPFLPE
ncbi:hypothetical protein L2E82_22806 [Cichorium intybus]|uniref:Uncharacterized protein n=1 Tax=Cichorium intybus TaxID=13427 RepID=A0ACB9DZ30_CICIN|nr:hypothetical protein L2E82_22806 [Cichorium intybus]